jgi:hypothetical protein
LDQEHWLVRIGVLPERVRELEIANCVKFDVGELVFLVFAFRVLRCLALVIVVVLRLFLLLNAHVVVGLGRIFSIEQG